MANGRSERLGAFARRTAVVLALVLLAGTLVAGLVLAPAMPLMAFVAVLGAVLLDAASRPLRAVRLPRWAAVIVTALVLVGLLVLLGIYSGPRLAEQAGVLRERIPSALESVRGWLAGRSWGEWLLSLTDGSMDDPSLSDVWSPFAGVFVGVAAALAGAGVVIALAFVLALDPGLYVEGVLHLVPHRRRERARELVDTLGQALRWWLLGRFASMTAVGLLTGIGLALLGVPSPTFLGVLAGLFSFIPYLGPLLSLLPALLVAFGERPELALWVAVLFGGVQVLEGNVLTPLIQKRSVSLPPVVLILAQVLMGSVFGLLGVLVATPLAVATIVVVQLLYVRDVIGDSVVPMGQHGRGS